MSATPGQTVGPFFGFALPLAGGESVAAAGQPGAVRLHGDVLDGRGAPVPDALLEIWQPDATGRLPREPGSLHRDGHTFTGWGRAATDATGHYRFTTVEPGATAAGGAPFVAMVVFARGLLDRLFTRVYLPERLQEVGEDELLRSVPPERRSTLVARREADGALRFDIRLQGEQETVFLRHRPLGAVRG